MYTLSSNLQHAFHDPPIHLTMSDPCTIQSNVNINKQIEFPYFMTAFVLKHSECGKYF